MRTRCARLTAFFIAFGAGLLVSCLCSAIATVDSVEPLNVSIDPFVTVLRPQPNTSDEMLLMLLPNDGTWADTSKLERYERAQVVRELRSASREASGNRALSIAFLLAAVGDDYSRNKSRLLTALKDCRSLTYPDREQCAYFISDYLIELARRGDTSLMYPLFEISDLADGAFSQSLGGFYSDALKKHPEQSLIAVRKFPKNTQQRFCEKAGFEDGGGMSDQTFREVKQQLHIIGRGKNSLSRLARRCAAGVDRAYTLTHAQP